MTIFASRGPLSGLPVLVSFLLFSVTAFGAQIQNQPVEFITSTPLSAFSDRSGLWPHVEIAGDTVESAGRSLLDNLNSIPGLQARELGSPVISIRGSSQSDRVLRLFEGVPLNLADGVGGSELFIPKEALSSVRLFKGPASVFFGSSAMAGAIDHRLRIFERPAARIGLLHNETVLNPPSTFIVAPFRKGNSSAQLSAFHERNSGQYKFDSVSSGRSGLRESNSSNISRIVGFGAHRAERFKLESYFVLAHSDTESPGSLSVPTRVKVESEGSLLALNGEYEFSPSTRLSMRASDVRIWGLYDRGTAFESNSFTTRTALSSDLVVQTSADLIVHNFVDIKYDLFNASYAGERRHHDFTHELGQSYEVSLSPVISLQPSFRYLPKSGTLLTNLGIIQNLEDRRVWVTYAEGYRQPSLSDLHSNVSYFKGNLDLKAERSTSMEVGFLNEHGKRYGGYFDGFSYGGAVYRILYENLVDTVSIDNDTTTKSNQGKAHAFGAELSAAYSFSIWSLSISYNYLESENQDTREPLRLAPDHQLSLSLSQQLGPIIIEVQNTAWSPFYDRQPESNTLKKIRGWNTFDLTARTIGLSDWEVQGGVLNLFDEPRELTLGFPEPQRRFFASVLRFF